MELHTFDRARLPTEPQRLKPSKHECPGREAIPIVRIEAPPLGNDLF
jgi:hypothetical protein